MKYIVGRDSAKCDIVIASDDDAVGRLHLEITDAGGGTFRITDLNSTNGTEINSGHGWKRVRGATEVEADTPIRLGMEYLTSAQELCDMVVFSQPDNFSPPPPPPPPPPPGPGPGPGPGGRRRPVRLPDGTLEWQDVID